MRTWEQVQLHRDDLPTWARERAAELAMDPDLDISSELRWLEGVILEAQVRVLALKLILSHPVVIPEIHYEQFRSPHTCWRDGSWPFPYGLLQEEYGTLRGLLENGSGFPLGVSVGGCMVTWDELVTEFGDNDD